VEICPKSPKNSEVAIFRQQLSNMSPKLRGIPKKNPLVFDSQVPTHLAHKFEKKHNIAGQA